VTGTLVPILVVATNPLSLLILASVLLRRESLERWRGMVRHSNLPLFRRRLDRRICPVYSRVKDAQTRGDLVMKKLVLASLCLLGWAGSPASAQFFQPPTTPYVRPPLFPNLGYSPLFPYSGYYYGNPAARPGPFYGYPYAPGLPGTYGYGPSVQAAPSAAASADLTNPNVTGHPTRFFSYSQYFFTQGGGAVTTATGTVPVAPPPRVAPVIGSTSRGRPTTRTGS
jgi:hypothetical protein